jgi:hypothetical protein
MFSMFKGFSARLFAVLAVVGLALGSIGIHAQSNTERKGRKYKAPPPAARIEVVVLRASDGKPIENAAVIFHPIEGDRDKGGLELKTKDDGKALIDVIPIGDTVRLQIIAKGYQTYGNSYKVDKEQMSMEIRMNRPGQQYSIYNDNESKSGENKEKEKSAPPKDEKAAENPPDKDRQN